MILWILACTSGKDIDDTIEFVDPSTRGPYMAATKEVQTALADGMTLPLQVWYPSGNLQLRSTCMMSY